MADATAEEVQTALADLKADEAAAGGDEAGVPSAGTTAAPDNSAAIAEAVARGLAESFGSRRVEAPVQAPQRKLTLKEQLAALTPEQRAELELKAAQNPLDFTLNLAGLMADERMEQFAAQANPYMQASGDLFIENFITQKSGSDPMFTKIEPLFRRELDDVDVRYLLQLPAAQRARQLNLRWSAASEAIYRKAAASAPRPTPPTIAGTGGRGAPVKHARIGNAVFGDPELAKDSGLSQLTSYLKSRGSLSDADVDDVEATYHDSY